MSLEHYFGRAYEISRAMRGRDSAADAKLQSILDRAMWDHLDHITLAPGDGTEARRLLGMVAWDRVPQARWPEVFEAMSTYAAAKRNELVASDVWLRDELREHGWLAGPGRKAA